MNLESAWLVYKSWPVFQALNCKIRLFLNALRTDQEFIFFGSVRRTDIPKQENRIHGISPPTRNHRFDVLNVD
jgi:hypothetical protein